MSEIMKDGRLAKMLGELVWKQRAQLVFKEAKRSEAHATLEYPGELILPGDIHLGIDLSSWKVKVEMAGHGRTLANWDATHVLRAWRAVQAAGMIEALGDVTDPDAIMLGRVNPLARVASLFGCKPRRWGGQNMVERLDEMLAERIRSARYAIIKADESHWNWHGENGRKSAIWYDVGGVSFALGERFSLDGGTKHLTAKHPAWGNVICPCKHSFKAVETERSQAYRAALGAPSAANIPLPPTGSARIARIANLCRQAVMLDPELADARGTRIMPLIERHLPDLLKMHAAAGAAMPADRLRQVDEDLDRGVEIIRRATEEALEGLADRRRDDLLTQLRFLETRHPDAAD